MATVIDGLNYGSCSLKSEIIYHHRISLLKTAAAISPIKFLLKLDHSDNFNISDVDVLKL